MADTRGVYSVTVCATVSTGLESVAVKECKEKLGCKTIREGRGRVYFDIPTNSFPELKTLRSVEHLFVVVKEFQENSEELDCYSQDILEKLYQLPQDLEWNLALSLWKQFTGYTGILLKSEISEDNNVSSKSPPVDSKISKEDDNPNSLEGDNDEGLTEGVIREAPAKRMKHSNGDSDEDEVGKVHVQLSGLNEPGGQCSMVCLICPEMHTTMKMANLTKFCQPF